METLRYIERKTKNRKGSIWKSMLLALAVSLGFWLCMGHLFGLSWSPGEMFSGGLGSGLCTAWNQAADILGSSDYILLTKTAGGGDSAGLVLTLCFLGTAVLAWFLIRSRRLWTLLIFVFPAVLGAAFQMSLGMAGTGVLAAALLASAGYMKLPDGFWMVVILAGALTGFCMLLIQIPGISNLAERPYAVREIQTAASGWFRDLWYGTNGLGNGDLTERERSAGTGTALEVTMSVPQSMYLRGFTGDMYTGDSWEHLPASVYYNAGNLMYWLEQKDFSPAGQVGQAAALTGQEQGRNQIEITLKDADGQYAYIPYEIQDAEIENTRNWGNEFFTSQKGSRIRSYTCSANDNSVKSWTSIAGELFTDAQNQEADRERIQEYLLNESYYNEFVYNNYTYISKSDRKLLYQSFGSGGDQLKGHIDYKKAISDIRSYLKDNFIYTENLGAKAGQADALEEFLSTKKGYDVQFATAATLLFRYYGIPARYVEGYLITPEDADGVQPGETIRIMRDRIHAWTEIYIDGVGFVPVEVSPPYEGLMEEADMEIGISNNSLLRTFSRENTGGASEDTELISGGDEEKQQLVPYRLILTVTVCVLILFLLILAARILYRRFAGTLKRKRLFQKGEPKIAVSAIYGYMERMHYPISGELRALGNRAAYSRHPVSEAERKQMLICCKEAKKEKKNHDRECRKREKKKNKI